MKRFRPFIADEARILIGKFFKDRREEMKLSARELAEMAGTTHSQISNFENGKANITINTLLALCGCLRIKPFFETSDLDDVPSGLGKPSKN